MVPEFPQHEFDACEREERFVGIEQPVMSDQDAALEAEPRVGPLHDVPEAVAMRTGVFPERRPTPARSSIVPLRDDRRDPALPQREAERAAVIRAICQEPAWPSSTSPSAPAANRDVSQNAVGDLQFVDVGAFNGEGEGRSIPVDEDRSLGPLANLGDADTTAPFFAAAKLASKIPCDSFRRPRFPSCPKRTRRTRFQRPARCQLTSLSQQVEGAPYSRGMSFQRQPVLRTKRIPLMVRRSSFLARPRRFLRGSSGWMSFQSLADRSVSLMGTPLGDGKEFTIFHIAPSRIIG